MAASSAAIMPIVFCASFAPWPKDTAAAETTCRPLNGRASSDHFVTFWITTTRAVAAMPTLSATAGETTIATAVLRRLVQFTASVPPAASPAPTRPPITAWLEEEGIPTYQVA